MDAQTREATLRFWEQRVRTHGDLVVGAVEALEHFHVEGGGGFEALKVALIEEAARHIAPAAEVPDYQEVLRGCRR